MNAPIHPLHFIGSRSGFEMPPIAITPEVSVLLQQGAICAIGVSGGKDSDAAAIAVDKYLRTIGHTGPKLLVHSDLGRVEWQDSLPACERLAEHLGWELLTLRRQAGDMMDRWETRWKNNVSRYQSLSCVKVILPWSTPSMRFCTSEFKAHLITSALKKRFPTQDIINVTGIRRQESTNRSRMPVATPESKLKRKGNVGFTWNPIIEWKIEEVFGCINAAGLQLHEAYTKYNASRVSCAYCIMSSASDLAAAASCPDNRDIYVQMVELEAKSTFAFQGNRWLGDVAPQLLPPDLRDRLVSAKQAAERRQVVEGRIPKHLLYTKGWPTCLPTPGEAQLLAEVRTEVADILGLNVEFTTAEAVAARYAELLLAKPQTVATEADEEGEASEQGVQLSLLCA